jgi:hypothetical protein
MMGSPCLTQEIHFLGGNMESTLIAGRGTQMVTRDFLKTLPMPEGTRTHQPISHYAIVEALIETLGFRHISVTGDEYAVSPDGNKMFGLLVLNHGFTGCDFAIGIRNANDKSMRLALTVGYRVFVCSNMCFRGDFSPVLSKHSKNFNLVDALSIGVDRIQRNFDPLKRTVENWKTCSLNEDEARLIIYEAFIERRLPVPAKLISDVHNYWVHPPHDEFKERTLWALSNAFTEAFKTLNPIQQFQASAKLSPFIDAHYQPF